MPVHTVQSEDEYDQFIQRNELLVVDFFGTFCKPCTTIAPKYQDLSMKFPTSCFVKVDIEANENIAEREQITSIPSFYVYHNGKLAGKFIGASAFGDLQPLLDSLVDSPVSKSTVGYTAESSNILPITSNIVLRDMIQKEKAVVALFFDQSSDIYKRAETLLEGIATPFIQAGAIFVKFDLDVDPNVSEEYEILHSPTVMLFNNGIPVSTAINGDAIRDLERQLKALYPLASNVKSHQSNVNNTVVPTTFSTYNNNSQVGKTASELAGEAVSGDIMKDYAKKRVIAPIPPAVASLQQTLDHTAYAVLVFGAANDTSTLSAVKAVAGKHITVINVDHQDVAIATEFGLKEKQLPVIKTVYKGVVYHSVKNADYNKIIEAIEDLGKL